MKKRFNMLFVAVMFTLLISVVVTFAATGVITYASITLPSFQGEVVAGQEEKATTSYQYYKNAGTISSFLGKEESVLAKLDGITGTCEGSYTRFITIGFDSMEGWDAAHNCTGEIGRYQLTLKRASFLPTTAYHSGTWYLDERFIPS